MSSPDDPSASARSATPSPPATAEDGKRLLLAVGRVGVEGGDGPGDGSGLGSGDSSGATSPRGVAEGSDGFGGGFGVGSPGVVGPGVGGGGDPPVPPPVPPPALPPPRSAAEGDEATFVSFVRDACVRETRGGPAREEEERARAAAATKISAAHLGRVGRTEYLVTRWDVVRIQSAMRGALARRATRELRRAASAPRRAAEDEEEKECEDEREAEEEEEEEESCENGAALGVHSDQPRRRTASPERNEPERARGDGNEARQGLEASQADVSSERDEASGNDRVARAEAEVEALRRELDEARSSVAGYKAERDELRRAERERQESMRGEEEMSKVTMTTLERVAEVEAELRTLHSDMNYLTTLRSEADASVFSEGSSYHDSLERVERQCDVGGPMEVLSSWLCRRPAPGTPGTPTALEDDEEDEDDPRDDGSTSTDADTHADTQADTHADPSVDSARPVRKPRRHARAHAGTQTTTVLDELRERPSDELRDERGRREAAENAVEVVIERLREVSGMPRLATAASASSSSSAGGDASTTTRDEESSAAAAAAVAGPASMDARVGECMAVIDALASELEAGRRARSLAAEEEANGKNGGSLAAELARLERKLRSSERARTESDRALKLLEASSVDALKGLAEDKRALRARNDALGRRVEELLAAADADEGGGGGVGRRREDGLASKIASLENRLVDDATTEEAARLRSLRSALEAGHMDALARAGEESDEAVARELTAFRREWTAHVERALEEARASSERRCEVRTELDAARTLAGRRSERLRDRIERLEREAEALEGRNEAMGKELDGRREACRALGARLERAADAAGREQEELRFQIASLEGSLDAAYVERERLKSEAAALEGALADAEESAGREREKLKAQVASVEEAAAEEREKLKSKIASLEESLVVAKEAASLETGQLTSKIESLEESFEDAKGAAGEERKRLSSAIASLEALLSESREEGARSADRAKALEAEHADALARVEAAHADALARAETAKAESVREVEEENEALVLRIDRLGSEAATLEAELLEAKREEERLTDVVRSLGESHEEAADKAKAEIGFLSGQNENLVRDLERLDVEACEVQEQLRSKIASLEALLLESREEENRLKDCMRSMEGDHAEALARTEEEKDQAVRTLADDARLAAERAADRHANDIKQLEARHADALMRAANEKAEASKRLEAKHADALARTGTEKAEAVERAENEKAEAVREVELRNLALVQRMETLASVVRVANERSSSLSADLVDAKEATARLKEELGSKIASLRANLLASRQEEERLACAMKDLEASHKDTIDQMKEDNAGLTSQIYILGEEKVELGSKTTHLEGLLSQCKVEEEMLVKELDDVEVEMDLLSCELELSKQRSCSLEAELRETKEKASLDYHRLSHMIASLEVDG